MTHIDGTRDADLHLPDGSHRSHARTANGRDVEQHERRIAAHMEGHRTDMASFTQKQIDGVKEAAAPLEGSPYALSYITAPTPTDVRFVFQHTVALTLAEAHDAIATGLRHLADGTAEWSSGEPYVPQVKDSRRPRNG